MLAQILGIVAMVVGVLSFQAKSSGRILIFQITANCFWTAHYCLLGAYTGAILNAFAIARNSTYFFLNKNNVKGEVWYACGFSVLCVILSLLTYANWMSLLPMAGSFLQSFSYACKNANKLRLFTLLGSPLWLIYNALNTSVPGIITEAFCMISMIVALIRYRNVLEVVEREPKEEKTLENK